MTRQITAGLIAGTLAGVVMSASMMAYLAVTGQPIITNANLIAVMWMGERVADDPVGVPALVGMATHLVTSALMGIVAVPFIRDLPRGRTYLAAISYAVASYPVVFILVLSWANRPMVDRAPPLPMLLEHVVFGVVLAWLYLAVTVARGGARAGGS